MEGEEVRQTIEQNNSAIEKLINDNKGTFVLIQEVVDLMNYNDELRTNCPHEDNGAGVCKFCYTELHSNN